MPGKNKAPLLGWHPPPELAAWAREEAERRGGGRGALSDLLTEALRRERQRVENRVQDRAIGPCLTGCTEFADGKCTICGWADGWWHPK